MTTEMAAKVRNYALVRKLWRLSDILWYKRVYRRDNMSIKDILTKITDTVTIVFPALIAVLGVFSATQVIHVTEQVEQVLLIVMGVVSSVCSIWFNQLKRTV